MDFLFFFFNSTVTVNCIAERGLTPTLRLKTEALGTYLIQ